MVRIHVVSGKIGRGGRSIHFREAATMIEKSSAPNSRDQLAGSPNPDTKRSPLLKWTMAAAVLGAGTGSLALLNSSRSRTAQRDNPPVGKFIAIDGVKLHYLDEGQGPIVVLLHGNGTTLVDWMASGVVKHLAQHHRVIAFDRPGFGYTDRPRTRIWTP